MIIAAQIIGIAAVASFLLSFQFKSRKNMLAVNILSRALYILQYLMLGAFEGAVLDSLGMISSVIAKYKDKVSIRRHCIIIMIAMNVLLTAVGLVLYENIFSLFAILGIVLEVTALWITKEAHIRKISLLAAPFWLTYNLSNLAYGSAVGNVLVILSITAAMIRYDRKNTHKSNTDGKTTQP